MCVYVWSTRDSARGEKSLATSIEPCLTGSELNCSELKGCDQSLKRSVAAPHTPCSLFPTLRYTPQQHIRTHTHARVQQHQKQRQQYNIFGRTFQAVLECEDSEVQWDESRKGFDASVVYIHRLVVVRVFVWM